MEIDCANQCTITLGLTVLFRNQTGLKFNLKSTVIRKVSKESNTGFRFCSKINTTYQGLLRVTSILTL